MSLVNTSANGEIFLQNDFISIGINAQGTLGTRYAAPSGVYTDIGHGYARLGFYADVDGFGQGKASPMRDAILGGTAIETFAVGYNLGGTKQVFTNSGLDGKRDITGVSKDTTTASAAQSTWTGETSSKVGVNQVITLSPDSQYLRFDVTLSNNTGTDISDVRYLRSIDPDLNPATYATYNKIVLQGDGKALVTTATSATGSPMFIYAVDDRASVSIYGFENFTPYDANVLKAQAAGYVNSSDISLNLNFNIGTLLAGQSTTISFYIGMTSTADFSKVIAQINEGVATVPEVSEPAPNPVPTNDAPVAAADSFKVDAGKTVGGNVLTNDSDANGDALSASLATTAANGTVKLNADGTFTYTPNDGFSGTDSFTYKVSDGSLSSTATVRITVNGAPVAADDRAAVNAGSSVNIAVLGNDTDPDGTTLSASLVSGPANGTVKLNADGTFTYTPKDGFAGTDSFVYKASDGSLSGNATVTIAVNGGPKAAADSAAVNAGSSVSGKVLANDTDPNGDALTASLVTGPANGKLTLNADGSYTYTPNAGFSGTDSFVYKASDGKLSDNATVTIAVNGAPKAAADSAAVNAGSSVSGKVLANDTDPNGDALTASLVTGPANGKLTLNADGSYTYTPNAGFSGTDSFVYKASDGKLSDNATVSISVNGAPVTKSDVANTTATAPVTGNVLSNDTDPNGDALTATLVSGPANGTVTLNSDGSYTYVANAGFTGADSFVYKASDGKLSSNATVSVNVNPVPDYNKAPVAAADAISLITGATATGSVLVNDSDPDGDALTASLVSGPSHGTLQLNGDGSYTYVANAGFTGTDSFVYKASDGKLSSNATVSVTVNPVPDYNKAPVAAADSISLITGATATGSVLVNDSDPDGDTLTASLVSGPSHGTLKLNSDGSYTYVANAGFTGTDSFVYKASDGKLSSNATVSVNVNPVPNVAPDAKDDSAAVVAGKSVAGNVLTNDTDADGNILSASLVTGPAHGTVTLNADGSYTYVANAGYAGTDSFTYAASDGKLSDNANVNIVVSAPAPTPVVEPKSILDKAGTIDLSSATSQYVTGAAYHNAFYLDSTGYSGKDTITNFGKSDVLVMKEAIYDSNNDGFIYFSKNTLDVDGKAGADTLKLTGVTSIRLMGTSDEGFAVYANAVGRPNGAKESLLGNDTLVGDVPDNSKQIFFFDTALDLDLGNDTIVNFGNKDLIVTTSALKLLGGTKQVDFGGDHLLDLIGGSGAPDDTLTPGEAGHVEILDASGSHISALEFDGSVKANGMTYFVYSAIGSAVGVADLNF